MSTGKRAYDIMRSYVNQEWERIRGIDQDGSARSELDAPYFPAPAPPASMPSAPKPEPITNKTQAAKVLGVAEDASFSEINGAYTRLLERSEPTRFPENSVERLQALLIKERIQQAFDLLAGERPATEIRFQSLEIIG